MLLKGQNPQNESNLVLNKAFSDQRHHFSHKKLQKKNQNPANTLRKPLKTEGKSSKTQGDLAETQDFDPKTTCNEGSMAHCASDLCPKKKPVLDISSGGLFRSS